MAGRDMLDQDFDDDDLFVTPKNKVPGFKDDEEDEPSSGKVDVEIDVVDDTPVSDKDKWNADDKPVDDDPDEDEATKYSRRVKERIAKETAKVHAERRAKEDRERQLNEAASTMQRLIQENNNLKGLIENGEKVLVSEHQGRLESQLTAAKVAYREAHEAGDINGQLAAQENIAKIASQMDRLSVHRVNPIQRMDEKEVERYRVQQQPAQAQPEPEALSWQDKNRWFGRDDVMTSHAMAFHNQLTAKEGITPQDGDKYWKRIDQEMRTRFPERFQSEAGTAPRRTDTVVASPSRAGNGGGKPTRKVTLTETQVRLAKRLGLTPQQYAEQVVAESSQQEKEWVHGR